MNYKFEKNKLLKFLKQTIIISKLFLLFVFVVLFLLSSNINVFCSEVILDSAAEDIVHYKDITEKKG